MSTRITLPMSTKAEWIKFRSLRSSVYSIITLLVLTIGLGSLITYARTKHFGHDGDNALGWDPVTVSLTGFFFAEFVVGVVGAMIITGEYATSSIRTSLAAFPRRVEFVLSKAIVLIGVVFVMSEAMAFISFFLGQSLIKSAEPVTGLSTTIGATGVLHAVIFAGLSIVLLALIGFGLGLLLKRTAAAITVFVSFLLVAPILVAFLPSNWGDPITKWLPGTLARGMMSINRDPETFTPNVCGLVLLVYAIVVIAAGTYLFSKRDA